MQVKKITTAFILAVLLILCLSGCAKNPVRNILEEESTENTDDVMEDSNSNIEEEDEEKYSNQDNLKPSENQEEFIGQEHDYDEETSAIQEDLESNREELIQIHKVSYVNATKLQNKILKRLNQESVKTVYTKKYQTAADEVISRYKQKWNNKVREPLFLMNPYGNISNGMYLYYISEEPCKLQYTISVDHEAITDYQAEIMNEGGCEISTEHEGMLLGMIQGLKNYVTLTELDENDEVIASTVYCVDLESANDEKQVLFYDAVESNVKEHQEGLYYVMSNAKTSVPEIILIDGNGIRRAGIKVDQRTNLKLIASDDFIFYPLNQKTIVKMNRLGQITQIYRIKDYVYETDFAFDSELDCIFLIASKETRDTKADILLNLNLSTGELKEVMDFTITMSELYSNVSKKKGTWLDLDSLDFVNSNQLIVSSRAFSSMFCINDVTTVAKLDYIVAEKGIWENTCYSELVYEPIGSFVPFAGQSQIQISTEDKRLIEGQYYIIMYNSNYGKKLTYPEFDWSMIDGVVTEDTINMEDNSSFYYKIFVDENTQTFTLADREDVPFAKKVNVNKYHYVTFWLTKNK